jgi:raffinose/stachyose/melibiose transport system substrate-binding protein
MEDFMKKALLRTVFMSLILILGSALVFAGGGKDKGTTLTVAINRNPATEEFKALTEIAKQYSAANPGITVEVTQYPEYEQVMKSKMAANDLPDLFSTHGWSVARYSEYLEPLNNQSWISKLSPAIKPVITNSRGQVFVLPFDVDSAGVAFNRDVLDKSGVDPFAIKTWDDFLAACEKIKNAGFICIDIGGAVQDDWTVGNFFDWVAPSFLISNEGRNYRAALKDGSFDWNNWRPVAQLFTDFRDKGYLNPDYLQGTWDNVQSRLGKGELAFAFYGRYVISGAKQTNPNARYGFIPIPSLSGDTPTLATGENLTLGVWKNSPRKAEALKFLEYCSSPAVINRLAQIPVNQTGLVGAGYGINAGDLKEYFDRVEGIRGFPYFDREYLPNGMWDSLCKTGSGILAKTMTMDQVIQKMRDDYTNLRLQQ